MAILDHILPLLRHEGSASIYDEWANGRNALRDDISAIISAHNTDNELTMSVCGLKFKMGEDAAVAGCGWYVHFDEDCDPIIGYLDVLDDPLPRYDKLSPRQDIPNSDGVQPKPMPVFTTTTKWEGEVIDVDVDNHTFTARIKEEDSQDNPTDDYVEFLFSEVKKDEWKYIKQGALFNWHVGHKRSAKGQVENTSLIIFRMMPVWKNKAEQVNQKANLFSNLINRFAK